MIKIREIIFWILVMISLVVVLWYLFGNSPTFEQTILVLMLTVLFSVGIKMAIIGEKVNSMNNKFSKLENSFIKLSNDFRKHVKK